MTRRTAISRDLSFATAEEVQHRGQALNPDEMGQLIAQTGGPA
jgi:hypothetical protein